MKIKISLDNAEAIESALSAVNGKSSVHAFTTAQEIVDAAADAEGRLAGLSIPVSKRQGASAGVLSGGSVVNAYKYKRTATYVRMVRGSQHWFIAFIQKQTLFPNNHGGLYIFLSDSQDSIAVQQLRMQYTVMCKGE